MSEETIPPLTLLSLLIDLQSLRRLAALRGTGDDEGRALHHLLSETFGKGALQPFRLMPAPGARSATLYAYSTATEDALREALDIAAPELLQALGTAHLALRTMPETWREGRRLAFDLRARPMRRLLKPLEGWSREEHRLHLKGKAASGAIRKGAEVDAFLVARLRRFPDGMPDDPENEGLSREAVYRDWLAERLSGAATLDLARTRMVGFARVRTRRHDQEGGEASSEGPDATFHGELTVTDGAAFSRLLARGVGRHTAYGFGMLLLRPGGA
ncbi:type I-E CRISPR-associated protein Cas6/Cse3/CasE [Rhizobium sp. SG2393]|uniref:type I-E CRISPR-associated protein Cas6/Cse3/CasE n=1 Tax=Rhizobium sp. SG2393 TaxID=3276279 RepID=UPI00366A8BED